MRADEDDFILGGVFIAVQQFAADFLAVLQLAAVGGNDIAVAAVAFDAAYALGQRMAVLDDRFRRNDFIRDRIQRDIIGRAVAFAAEDVYGQRVAAHFGQNVQIVLAGILEFEIEQIVSYRSIKADRHIGGRIEVDVALHGLQVREQNGIVQR